MTTPRKYRCPACGEKSGVNIVYGMPSAGLWAASERGEVAIGGCCQAIDDAERQCVLCDHRWRIKRRRHFAELIDET